MNQAVNGEFKPTVIKETSHGLGELNDFINLFAYDAKIPSEMVGFARTLKRSEIVEQHPVYGQYMKALKSYALYLKAHANDQSVEAYALRSYNIGPITKLLEIVSRLQFFYAFDDLMGSYLDENIGWGMIRFEPEYKDGALLSTKVFLGDTELDLSKPLTVQCLDWEGALVEEYDLVDLNKFSKNPIAPSKKFDSQGKPIISQAPVNIGFRVNDASVANSKIHDEAYRRHGGLNKADIRNSMVRSLLEFPLVRIVQPDEDVLVDTYSTPVFTTLDYSHEIDLHEHLATLVTVADLKEAGRFNNLREFAYLNLFRWGINSRKNWKRGLSIVNAVMASPKVSSDENQTLVDYKLVQWGMACIQELQKKFPQYSDDITDKIIISGSNISKLVSMMSQSYVIMHGLIVTDVETDDLGFREARFCLRSKQERTRRFQSMARMNIDDYHIVELDKDDNMIGLIDAIDIMAIVNYGIDAVVVSFDGEMKANVEQADFYHRIKKYKPSVVEVK